MGLFKRSRREINNANREQGKSAEDQIRAKWEIMGYKVKRTGRGHDFKAMGIDPLVGKKITYYIEVKSGDSKPTQLQKQMRKKYGKRYVVERVNGPFGVIGTTTYGTPKKKKSTTKKLSDSIWNSSISSMWNPPKKKRRKSDSASDFWL